LKLILDKRWDVDHINLAQDRDKWRALVNREMNLLSFINWEIFE
jgi:hypothetical protein